MFAGVVVVDDDDDDAVAATTAVAVSVVSLSQVVGVAWLPLVRQPLAVSRHDSSGAKKRKSLRLISCCYKRIKVYRLQSQS